MSYKDEIFNFLSQPENLELAFEISNHLTEMKLHLERNFWTKLHSILDSKLTENDSWQAHMDDVTGIRRSYYGVGIEPENVKQEALYLYFRIEKEVQRPFMGISIWKHNAETYDGSLTAIEDHISSLRNKLKEKGFKNEKSWWVGWKFLDTRTFDDVEVCREIADGTYQAEKAEELWTLFQDLRKDLELINLKISKQ